MPDVILVVSADSERQDRLVEAAARLSTLIGDGRMVVLESQFPLGVAASAPDLPIAAGSLTVDMAAEIKARGSRADFLVAAQPVPQDDRPTRLAFRAALFASERPVLMVPIANRTPATFGRIVAIAWRDDAPTTRALMPALRLLDDAEEVHLLAGVRTGTPTPAIPSVLLEHGVAARLHVLAIGSAPFGELLLGRARELKADMLIMGAHAHSRLQEMIFGGVTQYVVTHADIPVSFRS
jgi:nucleotide-binding universal stress UspA family protein